MQGPERIGEAFELDQRQEAIIHLRMTRGKRQEAGGTGPGQRAIFHVRGKVCG